MTLVYFYFCGVTAIHFVALPFSNANGLTDDDTIHSKHGWSARRAFETLAAKALVLLLAMKASNCLACQCLVGVTVQLLTAHTYTRPSPAASESRELNIHTYTQVGNMAHI